MDIRTKNNITNDFLIYSGWSWIQKNLDRFIHVLRKVNNGERKVDLVILWDLVARDVALRNLIIKNDLQKQVYFLWNLHNNEKRNYYKQSIWVIFPSLYESFPFSLNEAVAYNIPILSSNYKNIKNIFLDEIKYFSSISESDTERELIIFIENKPLVNYSNLLKNYSKENTAKKFLEIILAYN
jgi:glycosyltransferase involved in cell wall biosynthesis